MAKMTVGQFGDELQGDFIYVRTIRGENIAILGLLDRATGYRQATTTTSKEAANIFNKIMTPTGCCCLIQASADYVNNNWSHWASLLTIVLLKVIGKLEQRNEETLYSGWCYLDGLGCC